MSSGYLLPTCLKLVISSPHKTNNNLPILLFSSFGWRVPPPQPVMTLWCLFFPSFHLLSQPPQCFCSPKIGLSILPPHRLPAPLQLGLRGAVFAASSITVPLLTALQARRAQGHLFFIAVPPLPGAQAELSKRSFSCEGKAVGPSVRKTTDFESYGYVKTILFICY